MRWSRYSGQIGRVVGWLAAIGAVFAQMQIRGGAETARFEAGDHVLYQERLAGVAIGSQVKGWEIVKGSYEVAEFQGKRWFRPLERDTRILYPLNFPKEFSMEFNVYLAAEAGARLKVFWYTARDLQRERMGPDGPSQMYLIVGRGYHPDHDFVHLRIYNPELRRYKDIITPGSYKFTPNQVHRVALQVRNGQLQLFVDGKRVGITPFNPKEPLVAFGFIFDAGSGHKLPYKDRPALVGEIRIAEYSRPSGQGSGGVFLYWVLPVTKQNLPQLFAQSQTYNGSVALEALRRRYQWSDATLVVIALPGNPFASGSAQVKAQGSQWSALVQRLKRELEVVRQHKGGLLVVGDGSDEQTEQARKLRANQRAVAFSAWLAQQGIGNAQKLLNTITNNNGYEGIYFIAENRNYEGILP